MLRVRSSCYWYACICICMYMHVCACECASLRMGALLHLPAASLHAVHWRRAHLSFQPHLFGCCKHLHTAATQNACVRACRRGQYCVRLCAFWVVVRRGRVQKAGLRRKADGNAVLDISFCVGAAADLPLWVPAPFQRLLQHDMQWLATT
jgi:hypothetical protein